jgi:hypothetical protein
MLSFNILYWDLIKFRYFANTTESGDGGEDIVTLWITWFVEHNLIIAIKVMNVLVYSQHLKR